MSLLSGEAGTMTSVQVNMKKPCESCGILLMQAGLEYADGTVANTYDIFFLPILLASKLMLSATLELGSITLCSS
jgi:hypothetical protein